MGRTLARRSGTGAVRRQDRVWANNESAPLLWRQTVAVPAQHGDAGTHVFCIAGSLCLTASSEETGAGCDTRPNGRARFSWPQTRCPPEAIGAPMHGPAKDLPRTTAPPMAQWPRGYATVLNFCKNNQIILHRPISLKILIICKVECAAVFLFQCRDKKIMVDREQWPFLRDDIEKYSIGKTEPAE